MVKSDGFKMFLVNLACVATTYHKLISKTIRFFVFGNNLAHFRSESDNSVYLLVSESPMPGMANLASKMGQIGRKRDTSGAF